MDIFQGLQALLGEGAPSAMGARRPAGPGMGGGMDAGGLGGLLNPSVLGGLVTALFAGKSGGGGMGGLGAIGGALGGGGMDAIGGLLGALMGGAGTMFDNHRDSVAAANASVPQYGAAPANPDERAARLLRALVFAAKSDGHIDSAEQAAVNDQLSKLNLGQQGRALVEQAMAEPLDPNRIANGVRDGQEAIQLYALSYAVTNADQFMERSYLDGLAAALRIPPNVKADIEAKLRR